MSTPGYVLYGVEASYYAAKIRACLEFKRIAYIERQTSRQVFAAEILPRVGFAVIPLLVTPENEIVQDTSDMVDLIESRHPQRAVIPQDAAGRVLSYLLEFLGDEWIKLPAMYYRWHYNNDFAIAEFGRNNDPEFAHEEQLRIGAKVAQRFRGWLEPLGVLPQSYATVEADYLALLDALDAHFAAHAYLLGGAPTLGDFAFYGPLYAHQYRDPVSGQLLKARAPRVAAWIERLRNGAREAQPLERLQSPPASLLPVLRLLCRDFVPILVTEIAGVQRWLAEQPADEELPRHCGTQRVRLGRDTAHEIELPRALFPYNQWMLQRLQDAWQRVSDREQTSVRATLRGLGAEALLDIPITTRVLRREFRLWRAA